MSPAFDLKASFEPAGDQPEAIASLVAGLEDGLGHQSLLGVTGSGKTYTMACVIDKVQRPTIVLVHNKTLAAQLYGEMKEFFPDNAVEYFVSYYDYYQPEAYVPASDTYIEKDASINDHIEQMRLSATKALFERPDTIIVGTVSSIYGLGDPKSYHRMVLHLNRGERIAPGSAASCGGWRRCSTSATRSTCGAARSGCAAMSSTCIRRIRTARRCASNCSTTKSNACACSTR